MIGGSDGGDAAREPRRTREDGSDGGDAAREPRRTREDGDEVVTGQTG
ncbi:MAG: hypothetical protein IGS54_10205 [Elainella sp. C42_A2020_010]|nr:hypothetical protein [Elainella sp. C42_A2020_010]